MNTIQRARGRWREILPRLGVDTKFLQNRHGPCPACGGKDRFRFDDKGGKGTHYCNGCDWGSGIDLVCKLKDWTFRQACDAVDEIIGKEPRAASEFGTTFAKPDTTVSRSDTTSLALDIWRETKPLPGSPGALHLDRRRVSYGGDALRWHPSCPFGKGQRHGCMVALVRNVVTNEPQAIHRTAIDAQGNKLSHLGSNGRLSLGPVRGGAIKLTDDRSVTTVIAIGEGIESTLSIRRLPDLEMMPVWSVLTAGGIAAFPVLPGIEAVWIGADHDASGTGQKAARALAQRLDAAGIEPIVIIPRTVGTDLNDKAVSHV